MNNFSNLKYFTPAEFTRPEKMNIEILTRLDALRAYLGTPIIITSSTDGVHADNSQHYLGNAVDAIFPKRTGSLPALWMIAERFGFNGIGIYPDWFYQDVKHGGLHLDCRPEINCQGARWIGVNKLNPQTQQNEIKYLPLSISYLKRCRILT